MPPHVVKALGLETRGLVSPVMEVWARVALDRDGTLDLSADVGATAQAIRRLSPADAQRWPAFCKRMHAVASLLAELYTAPPPDPLATGLGGLLHAAVLRVRKLGRRRHGRPAAVDADVDRRPARRLVRKRRAQGRARGDGRAESVSGSALGRHRVQPPASSRRQPTTAYFVPPAFERADVLRSLPGLHVREVAVTDPPQGRVAGVVLATARSSRPTASFRPSIRANARRARRSGAARSGAACAPARTREAVASRRPRLRAPETPGSPRLVLAPSLDHLERAYDDVKYGRVSSTFDRSARETDGPGAVISTRRFSTCPTSATDA